MKASVKDHAQNPYYNDARNTVLRNFLKEKRGNTALLGHIIYGNRSKNLAVYKNGVKTIGDRLWKKLQAGIELIRSNKTASWSSNQCKDDYIKEWLKTNKKVKMRLGNIVYAYNYGNKNKLTSNKFWQVINNGKYDAIGFDVIMHVIEKVNKMIDSNHPFATAAK